MKSNGQGNSNGGFVGWGNYGTNSGINAVRLSGWSAVHNYWWNNDLSANLPFSLADESWHHISAAWDGMNHTIYVDFVLRASRVTDGGNVALDTTANFCVGKTYGDEYFTGQMKGVHIYDVALVPRPNAQFDDWRS